MTDLIFAVEPYSEVINEMRLMYPAHWAEVAINKDLVGLNPDYDRYSELDGQGLLHLVTARSNGDLVGYHLMIVTRHLHHKDSLSAISDITYLKPKYRKGMTGVKFLKYAFDGLRDMGVKCIHTSCKVNHDFGKILERLGFKEEERLYTRVNEWAMY
jgi:GNAT superfamily N-acetyltransferase